jgi:hypothetical protein
MLEQSGLIFMRGKPRDDDPGTTLAQKVTENKEFYFAALSERKGAPGGISLR